MMAAISAADAGATVTLLEPNERLGKKLNITGKGRCNVTNNCGLEDLMRNIPRNGRFLYSVLSRFDGRDTMAFFEGLGVPLKTERGNRVFPVSDRSFDISAALEKELKRLKVRIVRDRAISIQAENGRTASVQGESRSYPAAAVVLATGGLSYPGTGSTGDGYRLAAALGHTVVEPCGSLVPLEIEDPCCRDMQGLSLKNVELSVFNERGKVVFREFGEMLFTHFGVSGPLVLSASAHLQSKEKYRLSIDLKPALNEQKLDARILRDVSESPNKDIANLLAGLVHRSMVSVFCEKLQLSAGQKANSLTREQRRGIIALLKHFELPVLGQRPVTEAVVTRGGIKVSEVNPATLQSKLIKGLFFAGEILDVDAYTGGFNLQIAWATGRQAGLSAAVSIKELVTMNSRIYSIAVDGPSGAGKSTLAKAVASRLGILYVDTGAIYRTIGCFVRRKGINPKDRTQIISVLPEIHVDMVYSDDGLQHMLLNGEDVTSEIREPEISMYASDVSAIPEVRDYLLEMQRSLARTRSLIMDGRDIGTVVLPHADVKIYLTAAVEKRAERRMKELIERGTPRPFEEVLHEMKERDWADSHREIAPLRQADDAVLVDTSDIGFDESLELLLSVIERKLEEQ